MSKSVLNKMIFETERQKIDSSFSNYLYGTKKVKALSESLDRDSLKTELTNHIDQDKSISEDQQDIKKTLFKHWKKGEYNSNLAERSWEKLVSSACVSFIKENCKEPRLWETMFPEELRLEIVKEYEDSFYTDLKKGKIKLEELFNG